MHKPSLEVHSAMSKTSRKTYDIAVAVQQQQQKKKKKEEKNQINIQLNVLQRDNLNIIL